jgi:hypothetical protein
VPHTRPEAPQAASQQRLVPVTSRAHRPDVHCPENSQPVPLARGSLHNPVSRSQPFPHSPVVSVPPLQVLDTLPSHSAPLPSHWTQAVPSNEQADPVAAHASAQQTRAPVAVASQRPVAHSSGEAHATPIASAQPDGPQEHSAPSRSSLGVQSALFRHVPYPRHKLTAISSGKSLQISSAGQSTGGHRASSRGASSQRPVVSQVLHKPLHPESQQIAVPPDPTTQ